ncbi:MAG TPA: peptidoglycan-binding domain-containing protein [Streptosporangiaceae bacterium]|nr:peptidoglycan-binding domain-containing protein [Streptosporangiaceae bacterium]
MKRRPRRRGARPAALAVAALVGAVTAVALRGGQAAPAPLTAPPRLATATVTRTDLVATTLTGGTLGYAAARPVVNLVTGIYTWLPQPGAVIPALGVLYRVDDTPVTLMTGGTPAWRPFALGMTGGRDVRQLQAALIAGHFADGLLTTPTGYYDLATADAVERWQAARGRPVTGWIPLGQVVFLPAAVLVGPPNVAAGEAASDGQQPYRVTTSQRTVTVPLNPELPPASVGEAVSIILPSQASVPGTVTAVGTDRLTVTPRRPRATGTGTNVQVQVSLAVQAARGVLAVPVSALLALAGGGYGLEVVTPSGAHHLTGVTTGLFAGGQVQVSGPGIAPGTTVVTAQ